MKEMRKVLTSQGYKMVEIDLSRSAVKPIVKEPEVKSETNTENDTEEVVEAPTINKELILNMEPQELRIVAEQNGIKLGNVKKKEKIQEKLIKELNLDEELV